MAKRWSRSKPPQGRSSTRFATRGIAANVVQCGYCQPGQTLAAISLLESNRAPDAAQIAMWMNGNLCRCGTYPRIKDAINVAAKTLAAGARPEPLTARPEPELAPLSPAELADPVRPYVQIKPDGTVLVLSSQLEMGQGAHTGLATIVAEELDADFDSIQVVNAANGTTANGDVYGNRVGGGFQITGASTSTRTFWARYRQVAAQARARLVAAASETWGVPPTEVEIDSGLISHSSGKRSTFAALATIAETMPIPDGVQPKDGSAYRVIGREGRLRVDTAAKILGKTRFTIDVSLPGMLTALVLHPPRFGARVASVDDRTALAEPGVKAVIPIRLHRTADGCRRGQCANGGTGASQRDFRTHRHPYPAVANVPHDPDLLVGRTTSDGRSNNYA